MLAHSLLPRLAPSDRLRELKFYSTRRILQTLLQLIIIFFDHCKTRLLLAAARVLRGRNCPTTTMLARCN
ncbi:hypothetical protein CRE_17726 [Caenorhabditis remanei]|uniref:Uncharacterized protein n=1 Tax=Caenorhabditis remanei TaxID=31234 RepID=E3NNP7_CAERE|nr:hypothetical protein CRE_17726 [Caenorhabditis remanei]